MGFTCERSESGATRCYRPHNACRLLSKLLSPFSRTPSLEQFETVPELVGDQSVDVLVDWISFIHKLSHLSTKGQELVDLA